MNAIIKQWAIAAVAVMGLGVNEFGCGAAQESEQQPDDMIAADGDVQSGDLGQAQEAISFAPGFGYDSAHEQTACSASTNICLIPRIKVLQDLTPVLTGHCAGPFWASTFATAKSVAQGQMSGTGFSFAAGVGGVVITPKCVSTLGSTNQNFSRVVVTNRTCPSGNNCKTAAVTIEMAGDTIVNACNASPGVNCTKFTANLWERELFHIAGLPYNGPGTDLMKNNPISVAAGSFDFSLPLKSGQKGLLASYAP